MARGANLLCLLGVVIVVVSLFVPWFKVTSHSNDIDQVGSLTLFGLRGELEDSETSMDRLDTMIALLIVGLVVSMLTPLGGLLLMIASFWLWASIPQFFAWETFGYWSYDLGIGEYIAVVGSFIVLASAYVRLMVSRRNIAVGYRLTDFTRGLRTFHDCAAASGPAISPRVSGLNAIAILGLVIGVVSIFMNWGTDHVDGEYQGVTGLYVLSGEYSLTSFNVPTRDLAQLVFGTIILGLALSAYSPLFSLVQSAGAASFLIICSPTIAHGAYGQLISVFSAVLLLSSLFFHVSVSKKPRLTTCGHSIYTYVKPGREAGHGT